MNRLGRLAWKSVNAVISLHEQKRMEDDPEYGAAVSRLRMRQCTPEDVELFNSRVIKSAKHPNGVTLDSRDPYLASMIVKTNKLRQRINNWKTSTVGKEVNELRFTVCAGQDRIVYAKSKSAPTSSTATDLTPSVQVDLLNLDMSSSQLTNALPGWLGLYIGMPVVLKGRNINTDLGITNGARGILRSF